MTNICQHGQLARQCDLCEKNQEIDALRARIAELEAALAAELETPAYHSGGASGIDFGGGDIKVYLTTTVGATTPPLTGPEEP